MHSSMPWRRRSSCQLIFFIRKPEKSILILNIIRFFNIFSFRFVGSQLKDNKINAETTISVIKMLFDDDPTIVDEARVIVNECADVTDNDRCEAAYKIVKCAVSVVKEKGFKTTIF